MYDSLLIEGRYDRVVGILTKKLMAYVKSSYIRYNKENPSGLDQDGYYKYIIEEPHLLSEEFTIELYIRRHFINHEEGLAIDGGAYVEDNIIEVLITLDPLKEPQSYIHLIGHLKDVLRHEIEHLKQKSFSPKKKKTNKLLRKKAKKMGNEWKYFTLLEEIPAMVMGLHFKAKNNKTSFGEEVKKYLDYQMESGLIRTPIQYEEIVGIWVDYYNRNIRRLEGLKLKDLLNEII